MKNDKRSYCNKREIFYYLLPAINEVQSTLNVLYSASNEKLQKDT